MTTVGLVTGQHTLPDAGTGPWLLAMALVCTVVAIGLLMMGIQSAGPATASVVSCLEPVAAVLLGAALLGEAFGPPQWLGTAGVVAAVVLLAAPAAARDRRRRRWRR